MLQYRTKTARLDTQCAEARALRTLCARYRTPFVINDNVDLCLEVGADGVHLGHSDEALPVARRRLGDSAIIGVTCHSDLDRARTAAENGATYVAFGRFFPSSTKPHAPSADLRILHQAQAELPLPRVAIGGITAENGATLVAAGAHMLAAIHYLFAHPDVDARVHALQACFAATPGTREI